MGSSSPMLQTTFESDHQSSNASPTSPSSATSRFGLGRAKGPPARSQTYDDHYYQGPGAPSAQTRGYAPSSKLSSIQAGRADSPLLNSPMDGASGSYASSSSTNDTIRDGWPSQFVTEPGSSSAAYASQWGQAQVAPQYYTSAHDNAPSSSNNYANAFQPPRALGLYNQQNHSSPSLARNSGPNEPPLVPPIPSLDDINLGLENMSFEQREQRNSVGTDGIYNSNVGSGAGSNPMLNSGPDRAMEIRSREGTASVYSLDSMYSTHSGQTTGNGTPNMHTRQTSNNSMTTRQSYGAVGAEQRRSQQTPPQVGGGGAYDDDANSSLPYDDPYRDRQLQQQQSGPPQGSPHPDLYNHNGGYYEGTPRLHHQASYASSTFGGSEASHHQQAAPQFSPQPPHGSWGYEQQAAAQNPYYAAQFGQGYPMGNDPSVWGQHPSLDRRPSAMSAMSGMSMASGMMPHPAMQGGAPFGRSVSSLHVPAASQPRMTRKGTSSSNASGMSNNSGPPITKASVDEYRQRIKADPDPEAQFNFAKYLIEAAKKINSSASGDEKSAKKYRDALLAESLKLIKRLATQGSGVGKPAYADAQFFLANCLGNGSLGLQVDHEKAYNLYVQASKQNHSSATYRTAVCNEVGAGTRRDHARAVLFYRKASALGDTAGMYKLGMILLNGLLGQQRNPKEAVNWLKRAASQADEDNPHALHELGLLYEKPPPPVQPTGPNGGPPMLIVPFDPAQARELFTQAGQLGYPPSQFKLGSCYEYGSLTCPVDPRRSIAWYTRAAERGDAESELALSGWYLTGSDGVLKQSDSEAYLWARRAANKGLPKAEYAVGYYSEVGIGVKQDLEEAKRWYMRSAAQGNKRAMQRLTELKKLGAAKAAKGGKGAARPTRQEAATECIVM